MSVKVVCLGEALWDYLADQPGDSLEAIASWTPYPGGAPANVACGLAKLGTKTAFVGALGEDPEGDKLVTVLEERGVVVTGLQRSEKNPTRRVYVLRDEEGDRTFAAFGTNSSSDSSPDLSLSPTMFADAHLQKQNLPGDLIANADYLVIGSLGLASWDTRTAVQWSINHCLEHQKRVILDVNWRPMFWVYPEAARPMIQGILPVVSILKLTEEEALWLFDTDELDIISLDLPSVRGILLTKGSQGCEYLFGSHRGHLPAFPVDVVDTTGAGDAFLVGFLHQLCEQGLEAVADEQQLVKMLRYGNAMAALTVMGKGAIAPQPTNAEIIDFLQQH